MTDKWFYTGFLMEDNETPITVKARSKAEERAFIDKGLKELGAIALHGEKEVRIRRSRKRA